MKSILTSFGLAAALAGPTVAQSFQPPELIEAARKEGKLVYYTANFAEVEQEVIKAPRKHSSIYKWNSRMLHAFQCWGNSPLPSRTNLTSHSPPSALNGETGLRWLDRSEPNLIEERALLENIVSDARRAAEIIARVRVMATRRATKQKLLLLDDIIREALLFLGHATSPVSVGLVRAAKK
jgi:hypothetical protein